MTIRAEPSSKRLVRSATKHEVETRAIRRKPPCLPGLSQRVPETEANKFYTRDPNPKRFCVLYVDCT